MIVAPNTPTRLRAVQADYYPEDFEGWPMPRPFTEEMFADTADALGISASGFANQANQLLAENLGNLLAAKIKKAGKHNEALAADQAAGKNLDGEPLPLPTMEDFDRLVADYDFSGLRVSTGTAEESLTPLEKIVYAYARKLIRQILKKSGLSSAGLKAPVTVPKSRDTEPGPGQISWDDFEALVSDLAEGNGVWGESELHAAKRAALIESAEAEYAAKKAAARQVEEALGV